VADIREGDRVRLVRSGSLTGLTGAVENLNHFGGHWGLIPVTLDDSCIYGYAIACAPDELELIEEEAVPV
jgi:hypothetical protein